MLLVGFRKDPFWVLHYLFIYINDMCNVSMLMKSIVFADNTDFFYSGDNLSQVHVKLYQLNWVNYIHVVGFKSISFL